MRSLLRLLVALLVATLLAGVYAPAMAATTVSAQIEASTAASAVSAAASPRVRELAVAKKPAVHYIFPQKGKRRAKVPVRATRKVDLQVRNYHKLGGTAQTFRGPVRRLARGQRAVLWPRKELGENLISVWARVPGKSWRRLGRKMVVEARAPGLHRKVSRSGDGEVAKLVSAEADRPDGVFARLKPFSKRARSGFKAFKRNTGKARAQLERMVVNKNGPNRFSKSRIKQLKPGEKKFAWKKLHPKKTTCFGYRVGFKQDDGSWGDWIKGRWTVGKKGRWACYRPGGKPIGFRPKQQRPAAEGGVELVSAPEQVAQAV